MKKISLLFFTLLLTFFLFTGCLKKDDNIIFSGKVEEIHENSILVGSIENNDFDKAEVSFSKDMEKIDFNFLKGQKIEVTILPEIKESYPVQVTAISIKLIGQSNYKVSYYRADSLNSEGFSYVCDMALNSETFAISSSKHLPIFTFTDKESLDKFIKEGKKYFQFDIEYDEKIFDNYSIAFVYINENSGSIRHAIEDIEIEDNRMNIKISFG